MFSKSTFSSCFRSIVIFLVLLGLVFAQRGSAFIDSVVYVNDSASGMNNGTSWTDAYNSLQSALSSAVSGVEIWVAEGDYKPGTSRSNTFQLKNGVAIFGGFPEVGGTKDNRDPEQYPTSLNGDIGVITNPADNSFHVVTGSGTFSSTIMDGFIIKNGRADDDVEPNDRGAGMILLDGHPILRNLKFETNYAKNGAGVYGLYSNVRMENIMFINNQAVFYGGGAHFWQSVPWIIKTTFLRNQAGTDGGGINFDGSISELINNRFYGNRSGANGGGINSYNSTIKVTNTLLIGNTAGGNYGGGIFSNSSTVTLTNSGLNANESAQFGGGFYAFSGIPAIINSIFWENISANQGEISPEWLPVSYSLVEGGYSGEGNISSVPNFIKIPNPGLDSDWGTSDDDYGDLNLKPNSPAIDKGSNALLPQDMLDLDQDENVTEIIPYDMNWEARISGKSVDIGPYENEFSRVYLPITYK